MSNTPPIPPGPKKRNDEGWLLVLYLLLLLVGIGLTAIGAWRLWKSLDPGLLSIGVLCVVVTAALYPIASALTAAHRGATDADPRILKLLQDIAERMLISDTAKRIAFREQDRNALRQAIIADIEKHDYEAALALVAEMSHTYGYRLEAEQYRDQILSARKAETEQRVAEGMVGLDRLIKNHEWDLAMAEADKLARLYPDSSRTKGLDQKVRDAREAHKHQLERDFLTAAERDDVERAMDLLKELDRYLSESEAEPLRETARGVIGKKRQNLGVQFKLAVQDREWTQAVRIGEQIIREFPNTKMADEVRSRLDRLRGMASGQQAVNTPGPSI